MPALQTAPQLSADTVRPNPTGIFEILNRHQHTMALKSALDLELFTHIGAGATTAQEIAHRSNASERGTRILCDFLTIMGLLRKVDGEYSLTPDSAAFLDKASPSYFGSVKEFITHPAMLSKFSDIAELVRQGGAPQQAASFEKETDQWVEFARSMTPMVMLAAKLAAEQLADASGSQRILDIAAGSGVFGISIAQLNPTAEITAVDWENVLEVARENAIRYGMRHRFNTIAGSAFDADLGGGYDLVLLPNFLHHFDPPTNVQLLKKARKALKSEGHLAVVEFVPNDDRITPPTAAAFSLVMLANSPNGDAYTLRELNEMFIDAGFRECQRHDLLPTPMTLLVTSQ